MYCYYSHFADEDIGLDQLSNLSEITHLIVIRVFLSPKPSLTPTSADLLGITCPCLQCQVRHLRPELELYQAPKCVYPWAQPVPLQVDNNDKIMTVVARLLALKGNKHKPIMPHCDVVHRPIPSQHRK